MVFTSEDLQKFQAEHPNFRMELVEGEIIVMSPSGYESEEVASRMLGKMFPHVDANRLGRVTGSNAGFTLPNTDTRAPDVSFVLAERLRRSPRSFAELAPDLMVEVKSSTDSLSTTDSLSKLETKIFSFLEMGTRVGILVNPDDRTVKLYRTGQEAVVLKDGELLTVPELLPGWAVAVEELWPPVFE